MASLRRVQSLFVILLTFMLLGISLGLSFGVTKESLEYRTLSQRDVTEAFAQKGLKLIPVKEKLPDRIILGGIEPEAYKITNTEDWFFVYEFDSHADRYNFTSNSYDLRLRDLASTYSQSSMYLTAKNMLIVYSPHEYTFKPKDPVVQRFKMIQDIVFTDLNKGHTLVFRGEGQFWEAQTINRYTQQFYKDAHGVLRVEGWGTENSVAKYKGQNVSEVGPIRVAITKPHGLSRGTGISVNSKGVASLGGSGGNGTLNDEKDTYTITIEWKDQKETFDLEVHPSLFALFPY